MAQENNPFYIDPFGGANVAQGLAGLGAGFGQMRQRNELEAEKQKALALREQMVADVTEAYTSKDPDKVAAVMIKYPEMAQNLTNAMNFKDETTKNNFVTSARSLLTNPEQADQIFQSRIELIKARGGDPKDTEMEYSEYKKNPEAYLATVPLKFASYASDEWKAYQEAQPKFEQGKGEAAGSVFNARTGEYKADPEFMKTLRTLSGKDLDTANIRDLENYKKLQIEDPKLAEKFARMIGLEEKDLKEIQLTEKILQAKGEERDLLEKMTGTKKDLTPTDMAKINDTVTNIEGGLESVDLTLGALNKLLDNENYLDRLSGVSGAIPFSMPGEGTDAQVAFDNFKDNLTLTNLSKMSGVLTDRDIAVLASAASGVRTGMKKETLKNELKAIKARILASKDKKVKMLDAFKGKYGKDLEQYKTDKTTTPDNVEKMSDQDLFNKALGG